MEILNLQPVNVINSPAANYYELAYAELMYQPINAVTLSKAQQLRDLIELKSILNGEISNDAASAICFIDSVMNQCIEHV